MLFGVYDYSDYGWLLLRPALILEVLCGTSIDTIEGKFFEENWPDWF